ncbi:MAG: hypothetical protein ACR2NF_12445 [Pirellulales bacterium]
MSDVSNQFGGLLHAARLTIWAVAFGSLFASRLSGVLTFVTLLVAGRAIDSLDGVDAYATASIWTSALGPFTPSLIIFFILCVQTLKFRLTKPNLFCLLGMVSFLIIPLLSSCVFDNTADAMGYYQAKTDLRMPLLLCTGMYLFQLFLIQIPNAYSYLSGCLIGSIFARHLIDFVYSFSTKGVSFGHGNIVSLCPTKGLVIFLFLFTLFFSLGKKHRFISSVTCLASVYLLAAYNSRGLYLDALISALLALYILPQSLRLKAFSKTLAFSVSGVLLLALFRPDTAWSAYLRISSFTVGVAHLNDVGVDYNWISRIDPIRYAEWINILFDGVNSGSLLCGKGVGGSYTDLACGMPLENQSAFPIEQTLTGRFFYAHDLPTHFILKYGITGLVIFLIIWLSSIRSSIRYSYEHMFQSKIAQGHGYTIFLASLIAYSPTAIHSLWWSGKGILLTAGFVIFLKLIPKFNSPRQNNFSGSTVLNKPLLLGEAHHEISAA